MEVSSLNADTVVLVGPAGTVDVKVVGVEAGMLLFVTPRSELLPAASYTLFIQGANDTDGQSLPFSAITFTTAALNGAENPGNPPPSGSAAEHGGATQAGSGASPAPAFFLPGDPSRIPLSAAGGPATGTATGHFYTHALVDSLLRRVAGPAGAEPSADADDLDPTELWSLEARNFRGDWRSLRRSYARKTLPVRSETRQAIYGESRVKGLTPQSVASGALGKLIDEGVFALPSGATSVTGQALKLNGRPLSGVQLSIGGVVTYTDANGEFALSNVPSGHQILVIDGGQGTPARRYGRYEYGISIEAGKINALPFIVWMTRMDRDGNSVIASPTMNPTVVTNPDIPGLELRI
ncbi:MAG: Ig-like domain-containing domain, partial [Bradyrhizobium sp.]